MRHSFAALILLAAVARPDVRAQIGPGGVATTIRSGFAAEHFGQLFPSRVKTFVKASYDPDDRVSSAYAGNDDGFTGSNSCEAYRATDLGGPLAVLAHFEGRAGVLGLFFRNFWSDSGGVPMFPGENNRTRIWLDGVLSHDMPLADYFRNPGHPRGQVPPFTGPFTGNRSGGHLTHAQLRWSNSFKLGLLDDGFTNAARFHRVAATIASPEGELPVADMIDWTNVAEHRGKWPHATPRAAQTVAYALPASGSQALVLPGPSALLELTCMVPAHSDWNSLWVRCFWDGASQPAVDLPLRLLGGMIAPPQRFPLRGLMFGNDGDLSITCYMPMPFATSGRLEFQNRGAAAVNLTVTYAKVDGPYPRPWGYFTAVHHSGVTALGEPFQGPRITNARGMLRCLMLEDLADQTGRIPEMHMSHLEGDLCIRINGNRGEDHSFDASETSIGRWGWYQTPADRPFVADTSFQSSLQLRTLPGGYLEARRLMGSLYVFDPVHFVDGLEMVLEHGVQNTSNAEYGLTAFLYVEPGAARRVVQDIDIGSATAEAAHQVQFTQWSNYTRTGGCLRDQFFGSQPITDSVRHVRDFLRFRVTRRSDDDATRPFAVGFRLDRLDGNTAGVCQATVLVDGQYAGLLHSFTHNSVLHWKEGGECEVELPRNLTDGRASFQVEVRPRPGTDALRIARIWTYEYTK